jgi:hypothetical protein
MALTRSFPIDQGYPTALDLRRLDAGLIVREGILADPTTVAVAGIAFGGGGFNVSARPFVAALKRGGAAYSLDYGVARLANDAAGAAWTIPAAPVSNSRIDLLWIRATDPTEGEATSGTDGPGDAPRAVPIFGVSSGTAAPSPVAPALPAGAYLIATVTTPSGAASIAGSTIVQSYGFAQLSGGTVYARTLALLPTTAVEGDRAVALGTGVRYERTGSAWLPVTVADEVEKVADLTALAALPTGPLVVGDLAHVAEGAVYMSWTGAVWRQVTTASFASAALRDAAFAKASAAFRVVRAAALDTSTGVESRWSGTAFLPATALAPAAYASNSAVQSTPQNVQTVVNFAAASVIARGGIVFADTPNTFTVPAAGLYRCVGHVVFNTPAGVRAMFINVGGVIARGVIDIATANGRSFHINTVISLAANAAVTLSVLTDVAGGSIFISGGSYDTTFTLEYIGAP